MKYGDTVLEVIKPALEEYAQKHNMGVAYYSNNRDIAIVNESGKNVAEVTIEYKNIRVPMLSDIKVSVEPYYSYNHLLHPNVRLKTRSFTVKNGEDHVVIANKVVRFVHKLVNDFEKAFKDSDEYYNAINTAKNNRTMAINDALRNHPDMEYDESIEQVRYKEYRLTPVLRNDEVYFKIRFDMAQTKYVNVEKMKMILD